MENDVRGSQTGLWTTGWEPSFMNICSERCAAVKQSERVTLLCLSLTCVCVCVCLHSSVKEKLTADPDSEIATTSLRVSLLCPVNMTLFETFWQVQTRLFTLWRVFFTCLWLNMSWCAELLPEWMMSDTILTVCFLDPYPVSCACGGLRVSHPVIPP